MITLFPLRNLNISYIHLIGALINQGSWFGPSSIPHFTFSISPAQSAHAGTCALPGSRLQMRQLIDLLFFSLSQTPFDGLTHQMPDSETHAKSQ